MKIVGIDPGTTGAIAIIEDAHFQVYDLTKFVDENDKLIRRIVTDDMHVYLENPRGTRFVRTAKVLFRVIGGLEVSLSHTGCAVTYVEPRDWMQYLGLALGTVTANHEARRTEAYNMFPDIQPLLRRKKDHNRADAMLIAYYGWCVENETKA